MGKTTKTLNTIFLTSFRKTSQHDINRLRNKLQKGKIEIIKGKL
jgi:ribosomal protein L10